MRNALLQALRFAVLAAIFAGVAAFSQWPSYRSLPEGVGVLTLSFSHGADRKAGCRKLSAEEIAALPANMRRTESCPRGRPPVFVELDLNGKRLFGGEVGPSGIAGDGPSRVHQQFVLPAGIYEVSVRMRDRPDKAAFDYEARAQINIDEAAHRVIEFRPEAGGFLFR
jgi:hypothetical protein